MPIADKETFWEMLRSEHPEDFSAAVYELYRKKIERLTGHKIGDPDTGRPSPPDPSILGSNKHGDPLLGCGAYGCVFSTVDPYWVVKVSADASEGEVICELLGIQNEYPDEMAGIAWFENIWQIPVGKGAEHPPLWVILREAVSMNLTQANNYKKMPHDRLWNVQSAGRHYNDGGGDRFLIEYIKLLREMGRKYPQFKMAVKSMIFLADKFGIVFGDAHAGNFAVRVNPIRGARTLGMLDMVLFDPGFTDIRRCDAKIQMM